MSSILQRLAYYTVFSLAPLILLLLAVFGLIYGNSEVARREILHQLYAFLDRSSARAVEDIASSTGQPAANTLATIVGIAVALFGASGVFGQLQDALNTIWRVPEDTVSSHTRTLFNLVIERLLAFTLVIGGGLYLLASLIVTTWVSAARSHMA